MLFRPMAHATLKLSWWEGGRSIINHLLEYKTSRSYDMYKIIILIGDHSLVRKANKGTPQGRSAAGSPNNRCIAAPTSARKHRASRPPSS